MSKKKNSKNKNNSSKNTEKNLSTNLSEEKVEDKAEEIIDEIAETSEDVLETSQESVEETVERLIEENTSANTEEEAVDTEETFEDDIDDLEEDDSDKKISFKSISKEKKKSEESTKKYKSNKKADKADKEDKESFGQFVKEFWDKTLVHIKNNKKIYMIAGSLFVLVIIIVFITSIIQAVSHKNTKEATGVSSVGVSASATIPVTDEPLEENAHPEINKLFEDYFTYLQNDDTEGLKSIRDYIDDVEIAKIHVKAKYIESYSNINVYTKKGPVENSYICFASYDVKTKDYDVVAPALLAFLVCQREDGSYYIYCNDFSQEMSDYINQIAKQNDVYDLITKINTQYNDILSENPEFADYMLALNQMIKNEAGELLAQAAYSGNTTSENSVSDNTVSDNNADDNQNNPDVNKVTVKKVKTTTTVNVRSSDSELADKLGKVTEGTVLTCNKQMDNGWSQIVYEDKVGYIKTEFLENVADDTDVSTPMTSDTVTVKETVKIRKSASTKAESLGVAYAGETFPKVEESGEWTKIIYDNKEAYIKTEFLD